jgi:hypothetical protein
MVKLGLSRAGNKVVTTIDQLEEQCPSYDYYLTKMPNEPTGSSSNFGE